MLRLAFLGESEQNFPFDNFPLGQQNVLFKKEEDFLGKSNTILAETTISEKQQQRIKFDCKLH